MSFFNSPKIKIRYLEYLTFPYVTFNQISSHNQNQTKGMNNSMAWAHKHFFRI